MNPSFWLKFLKFCVVGGSGVFIDMGITYLCKEILRINKYIANSLGFIIAATSNYILNRIWTFGSTDPQIARQYTTFIAISLVGLAINNGIVWLLNDKLKLNFSRVLGKAASANADRAMKVNFYISKLFAIGFVTIWNFLMNYLFTF